MLVKIDHVKEDIGSGILIYRRKFPRDLVRFIPGRSSAGRGRIELKVSLRSKDIRSAGAIDRYRQAQQQYEQIVGAARKRASGSFDTLDAPLINYLVTRHRAEELANDDATRWDPAAKARGMLLADAAEKAGGLPPHAPETRWTQGTRLAREAMVEVCKWFRASGDLEGLVGAWGDPALALASDCGFIVDSGSPGFRDLCIALNDAALSAQEVALQRLDGSLLPTPAMPEPPKKPRASMAKADNPATLQAIADGLLSSKASPVGHSTASSWSAALRFFKEVHGTPTPDQITRLMVSEWIELLAQRPAMLPKTDRGLALRPLVAKYAAQDVEVLSKKTVSRKGSAMYDAVETLLKGEEVELPHGTSFVDKDGPAGLQRLDGLRFDLLRVSEREADRRRNKLVIGVCSHDWTVAPWPSPGQAGM
jgi:hypothetical protein